ncbi:MAG: winged helix DNA-binding domain-containing protein [Gemmatimonadaceae bacterium]
MTRGGQAIIGRRALNRALLARQLLLDRQPITAVEALERLVGLQSQAPTPPYVGLWTRLARFHPDDLSRLILERGAVRMPLMRATIHLVTARDALALRAVVQPVLARAFAGSPWRRGIGTADLETVLAAGRALLAERPRTSAALGPLLGERWPEGDPTSLARTVSLLLPVVQVPPRGLWRGVGQATWAPAATWLGRDVDGDGSPDAIVLRYLAAFGPAGVMDARTWSGLSRLKNVLERLRPRLAVFRDERGVELFDLPDAPRPDPDTPAPVRFLPEWDNVLLSHADRSRMIADAHRRHVFTMNGIIRGTVLVDGFVAGTWRVAHERGVATLSVRTFAPLDARDRDAVAGEGAAMLAFVAADAARREVELTVVDD